ncbi:MAG: signal peptidase II [Tissierellia bacterium]|nr:signal peptidase II [Tissierellia bacterium]
MLYVLIIVIGLILDRITKIYAVNNFIGNTLDFNKLKFTYVENRGAAFGILQNKRFFFIFITIAIIFLITFYFIKNIKKNPKVINVALAMVISGAVGNFYDRLINHYVVDFIQVDLLDSINFPVFNVADILVTLGCFIIIIVILVKGDENVG